MNLNQRKHRTQMLPAEIAHVVTSIRAFEGWEAAPALMSYHAKRRAGERKVKAAEVLETIQRGQLIEVHKNAYRDVRALVRRDFGRYSVCVVVSVVHREVITVFVNLAEDQHYTLDLSQYQWRGPLSIRVGA